MAGAWIEYGSIGHGMVLPQTSGTMSSSNLVIGTNGAELLSGTVHPDIIHGLGGNDTLDGNQGIDTLIGGTGDDTYIVDNARDVTTENTGEGIDLVQSSVSYVISANIENLTLLGTAAINATGNALANTLTGNAGANTLDGAAGADTLAGGAGDDTYVFNRGSGQDTVRAETDNRASRMESLRFGGAILPSDVRARIVGTSLELSIENSTDTVTIEGFYADGNPLNPSNPIQQVLFSEGGVLWNLTTLVNLATASTITGSAGNDVLSGTAKADKVYGLAGDDALSGLAGNDTLDGGTGSDKLVGGTGDDTYIVDAATDTVTELAGEGTDLVQASLSWTLGANVENLQLTGTEALRGTGNALGNVLTGNSGANLLDGQAGADTMIGGAGNDTYVVDNPGDVIVEAAAEGTDLVQSTVSLTLADNVEHLTLIGTALNATGNALGNRLTGNAGANILDGQAGADTLIGGAGNDTYVVDNTADIVTEAATQGTDLIRSSVSYTASANVENLTLLGELDLDATGNTLVNTLTGNSGANVLDGLAGADKLVGGGGDDTYVVDVAGDVVVELAGEGTDLVRASLSWTLGANVENLTLTGTTALNATGNTLANMLNGNAGANTLDGGAGADTLIGAAGDDTYIVDNAGDTVTERMGEGTDLIQSSISYTASANVEKLTLTGSAALNATGNDLANVLTGNAGANVLDGSTGADTLIGGAGNDTYVVDVAGDVVTEATGQGTDLIQSAVSYTAPANIENLTLTGIGALDATGNTLANVLTGNSDANVLNGLAGADQLIGGAGDDTYFVDSAGDVVTELAGEGSDLILSSVSFTAPANVENLSLSGSSPLSATGNALANVLSGNPGINTLSGGLGNDSLLAGAGNDVLKGGADADLLAGGAGSDVFVFAAGDSVLAITGTADTGLLTGFDSITDFSLGYLSGAQDKIDTVGSPTVVANTAGFNGADSTLTLAGQTIRSHAILKGMVTFDDADTYAGALSLTSMSDVAAVLQYLQANDLGNAGASVAFDASTGGLQHTFLFTQGDNAGTDRLDVLVDLVGVNANGLTTSVSGVPADFLFIG
jgi:Ca2+-binding RTX toxin-like protein